MSSNDIAARMSVRAQERLLEPMPVDNDPWLTTEQILGLAIVIVVLVIAVVGRL